MEIIFYLEINANGRIKAHVAFTLDTLTLGVLVVLY